MLTVVTSLKTAGVTTTALALGYASRAVVVEADPSGGDVAAWMGWPDVALSHLAAAARREVRPELVTEHARHTGYGVAVVPARTSAEGAAQSVAAVVEVLPKLATELALVADAGRLDAAAATARLLPHADTVLLLVRPTTADLARMMVRLDALRQVCGDRLRVVLSGPGPYTARDVSSTLICPVAATLPYDPRTAAALASPMSRLPGPGAHRGRRRGWRWPLLEAVSGL